MSFNEINSLVNDLFATTNTHLYFMNYNLIIFEFIHPWYKLYFNWTYEKKKKIIFTKNIFFLFEFFNIK